MVKDIVQFGLSRHFNGCLTSFLFIYLLSLISYHNYYQLLNVYNGLDTLLSTLYALSHLILTKPPPCCHCHSRFANKEPEVQRVIQLGSVVAGTQTQACLMIKPVHLTSGLYSVVFW